MNKNNLGLVSISFRNLKSDEIITAVKNAGLSAVEWGSDVHCKPDDASAVQAIKSISSANNINICSYGSYYRVGAVKEGEPSFESLADTAENLGTDVIRVWAYNKGSNEVTAEEYDIVVSDMKRICGIAAKKNITVSLECHNWTLTDNYDSALKILDAVASKNLTMYWQPNQFKSFEYNLESAKALRDYVTNVHVFNWEGNEKYPLADAVDTWKKYVEIIEGSTKYEHNYLLEFMPTGGVEMLPAEAEALRKIAEEF